MEALEPRRVLTGLTDLVAASFDGASSGFSVVYDVENHDAQPFDIDIYRSYNGVDADQLLLTRSVTDPLKLEVGTGYLEYIGASFQDVREDYYLLVVIDAGQDVDESNETNNNLLLLEGVFQSTDGVVHIHGSDNGDSITVTKTEDMMMPGESFFVEVVQNTNSRTYNWNSVSEIHVRAHGGADTFSADEGISGEEFDKLIWGFGGTGDDELSAGDQDDWIFGGEGDDTIHGGSGDDALYGEGGVDHIFAELGDDLVLGGEGNDILFGDDGVDSLYGDNGDDTISGGFDSMGQGSGDYLYGGDGNDTLYGDEANSVPSGENDTLYGEAGDDYLEGGDGVDVLHGGGQAQDEIDDMPVILDFDIGHEVSQWIITGRVEDDDNVEGMIVTFTGDLEDTATVAYDGSFMWVGTLEPGGLVYATTTDDEDQTSVQVVDYIR